VGGTTYGIQVGDNSAPLGFIKEYAKPASRISQIEPSLIKSLGRTNLIMRTRLKKFSGCSIAFALASLTIGISALSTRASAQDADDPPGRVARLGYIEGSVSFQPAGESDWVGAVPNRPMTTGDQLWTDRDSRAEVQLGSAVIRLSANTGFSFLNLDDNTVQIQLTAGAIGITVRRIQEDNDFEIDTPNQAFTIFQPGHYRVEASPDGDYTVISVRAGEGESTGGGQTYPLRGGQEATMSGTDQVYADVEPLEEIDNFDRWCETRDHRFDYSRSARFLAPDVVGYEDLDDYGDWRTDPAYGNVWFPNRVEAGWAPYHVGHWDWIAPWGWTWVDDNSWGYAPFHYGRWVSVEGRWGWVAGPVAVRAVYAPALVVFVGGGPGGFGGNVGWFPLGPREVYVPSYHVSEAYVTRVNVSSTTVNVTQVTNVYRTTIINNNTTTITNITYANRNVQGAVMVVPQHAFISAQPVAKAAVVVNARELAAAPLSGRVAVAPTRESVLGARASSVGHVSAPPVAVAARQVVAKKTPPPPPVPFARQQQALAAHPGQPLARSEVQTLRPAANTAAARPMVKVAPAGKPATPNMGHPAPSTGNGGRPGQPGNMTPAQPMNRPANAPAMNERPGAEPNRPANQPANQPSNQPMNRPTNAPAMNERPAPEPNRPAPPTNNNRPAAAQPENRPMPAPQNRPENMAPNNRPATAPQPNRPEATPNRPENRPSAAQPENRPAPRPVTPPQAEPNNRPEAAPRQQPPAARPAQPPPKQLTPAEKKRQEEEEKKKQ
jgi:hypothetical protein